MIQDEIDALESELTIPLDPPIQHDGKSYDHLTLREPTASQVSIFSKLEGFAADIEAITLCSELPKAVIVKLPARKFKRASAFILHLLEVAEDGVSGIG